MRMQDYVRYSSTKMNENFYRRDELVSPVSRNFKEIKYRSITLIGSGSSYNSMLMVKDALQNLMQIQVNLYTPEHVLEFGFVNIEDTFVIVASQSGASTNVIKCLKYLSEQGIKSISLTGNINSQMANYSSKIFDYGSGNEYVDFVTTGVQTLVEFLLIFGCQNSTNFVNKESEFYNQLKEAIDYQSKLLNETEKFIQRNHFSLSMNNPTFFCGNGPNYGVAKEGALKFQETLKRPAMYYELEEFLHGPNMQLTPDHTVFLINDMAIENQSRFAEVFSALKEITPSVFLITSRKDTERDKRIFQTELISNWFFSPYYSLPVIQLIAAEMTDELKVWNTHPYFDKFDKKIAIKTDDYDKEIENIKKKWELENS